MTGSLAGPFRFHEDKTARCRRLVPAETRNGLPPARRYVWRGNPEESIACRPRELRALLHAQSEAELDD